MRPEPDAVIYCYDDGISHTVVDAAGCVRYLEQLSGDRVLLRESPVIEAQRRGSGEEVVCHAANFFARCRVRKPHILHQPSTPLPAEIAYEKRRVQGGRMRGICYEGEEIAEYYCGLLSRAELGYGHLHVVLSNQLLLSWDAGDLRYHARTVILGYPCLISLPGLVEGPARSREYYVGRLFDFGGLERGGECGGAHLVHDDERLREAVKGPLAQALFYHLFGETFCEDRGCRLFNARWQKELWYAQLESPCEFCPRHAEMIRHLMSAKT